MPLPRFVKTLVFVVALLFFVLQIHAQSANNVYTITVLNDKMQPLENVVVMQLQAPDDKLVKTDVTDQNGEVKFRIDIPGDYRFATQLMGYNDGLTAAYTLPGKIMAATINLSAASIDLKEVNISGKRMFLEMQPGKMVVNAGSSISNAGTNVQEFLPRLPGVSVDKSGTISLRGKAKVLVLIDGRQIYLSGEDLLNRLSGISSSQIQQVELIFNPSAKYDASGNAGIINIITKKNGQNGFNGNVSVSGNQGKYFKTADFINLNFKTGRFSSFFDYSANVDNNYTDVYDTRDYIAYGRLEMTTRIKVKKVNTDLRTGTDYQLSDKSSVGLTLSASTFDRDHPGYAEAKWLDNTGKVISTNSLSNNFVDGLKNIGASLNFNSELSQTQHFSVDVDALKYNAYNDQTTTNQELSPGGNLTGSIVHFPTTINIYAGKADYSLQLDKNKRFETGVKLSRSNTDNISDYRNYDGALQSKDLSNSYRYFYNEHIYALYSNLNITGQKINAQLGLRYENSQYTSQITDNLAGRNNSFTTNYGSLFPSSTLSYKVDSVNSFTLAAGRRIDRQTFKTLNPFLLFLNNYTLEGGNADLKPQFSWNFDLSHSWKDKIITTLSYNTTKNYMAGSSLGTTGPQVLVNTINVNNVQNIGLSVATQFEMAAWWSATASGSVNYKKFSGYKDWQIQTSITQFQLNVGNQFTISKSVSAELTGNYISKSRPELLSVELPTGNVSVGLSKTVLNGSGSVKLYGRDLFYNSATRALSDIRTGTDYAVFKRDFRYVGISFSYRFGKTMKDRKRSDGSAAEESGRAQ
ncbi:outer membrane beta-barrel protein [Mucilaginibacter calamicampi]|uniref:Outer membrane beta-barrel protein n=1 Tax=Mucilaginibacter calamicampi TaxID=1302352 RepID=A0ABW2YV75_9SPHI